MNMGNFFGINLPDPNYKNTDNDYNIPNQSPAVRTSRNNRNNGSGSSIPASSNVSAPAQFGISSNNPYYSALAVYGSDALRDYFNGGTSGKGYSSSYKQKLAQLGSVVEAALQWEATRNDREYNSESAQADRMREAGQNPDLQDFSPSTSSADSVINPTQPGLSALTESSMQSQKISRASQVLSNVVSVVSTAFGVYGAALSAAAQGVNIGIQKAQQAKLENQQFMDYLSSRFSGDQLGSIANLSEFTGDAVDMSNYQLNVDDVVAVSGLSAARASQLVANWNRGITTHSATFQRQFASDYKDYLESLKSIQGTFSSQGFNANQYAPNEWLIAYQHTIDDNNAFTANFQKIFNSRQDAVVAGELQKSMQQFQLDYYSNADGVSSAEAFNAQNVLDRDVAQSTDGTAIGELRTVEAYFNSMVIDMKNQIATRARAYQDSSNPLLRSIGLEYQHFITTNNFSSPFQFLTNYMTSFGGMTDEEVSQNIQGLFTSIKDLMFNTNDTNLYSPISF